MTINKMPADGNLILAVSGKLDTNSASALEDALIPAIGEIAAAGGSIVLDFSNLYHVSSAGLRVLFTGQKTAKARNSSMKIINVSDEIKEIFNMTGFSELLTVE